MFKFATQGSMLKRVTLLAVCLALFGGLMVAVERIALAKEDEKPAPAAKPSTSQTSASEKNWKEATKIIDEQLEKNWVENKVTPAPTCDDYEFVRRATLDIIGRIATPEEIDVFLKDTKEKR